MYPTTSLQAHWQLQVEDKVDLTQLMSIFAALDKTGNLSAAAKMCQLSYRHAWGLVRKAEQAFEIPLVDTSRRQGSKLTEFARQLLLTHRRLNHKAQEYLQQLQQEFDQNIRELYEGQRAVMRLHASHGFAVEGLMRRNADQAKELAIELHYRTGGEALAFLQRNECDVAGFQIPVGKFQAATLYDYRHLLRSEQIMLAFLAERNVGLFVQPGNPFAITSLAHLMRPDIRVVNRQQGSGSRHLMRLMIEDQGLDADLILNYGATEFTHMAVAAHVASGMADVGFGIETAARRCGLDFISLGTERYFFAFHRDMVNSEVIQQFLSLLRSVEYSQYMQQLVGYHSQDIGQLYTLQDAFGDDLF